MTELHFDCEKIYKLNQKLKKEDINQLKEWLNKQPHLPEATEEQLIWFLYSCYFDLELTKTTIDNFFTIKTSIPDAFLMPNEDHLKKVISVFFFTILPQKSPEGNPVMFCKLLDPNASNFNLNDVFNLLVLQQLLYLHQNGPIDELIVIADVQNVCLGHVTKCPFGLTKKIFFYLQNAGPVRIKHIHFVNVNVFFEKLFAIIKLVIHKSFQELMFFHKSYDSLWKTLNQNIFLEDDGDSESFSVLKEQNFKNITENSALFLSWKTQKVDETKRPKKVNKSFWSRWSFEEVDHESKENK